MENSILKIPERLWKAIEWRAEETWDRLHVEASIWKHRIFEIGGVKIPVTKYWSPTMKEAIVRGRYETAELSLLEKALESTDVVMELGTGIGLLASYSAKRIGSEHVFTYEANPELEPHIRKVFELNHVKPRLEICILGPDGGETTLYIAKDFWNSSCLWLIPGERLVRVRVKSFQHELERICPTFLIIDIEGGEYELFRKTSNLTGVQKVLIELHKHILNPKKINFVENFFKVQGFSIAEKSSGNDVYLWQRRSSDSFEKQNGVLQK
ncbi:MAG: FkbM family methyltransferase [Candidatus Omnitrophica bacterium]|nr:FkbM family methyltransferase [Candidatus Omnitrophota bacterium]